MIESQNLIDTALKFSGETLDFVNFTIKAIPGQDISKLYDQNVPQGIEKQDFYFRTSQKEFLAHTFTAGKEFTYTNGLNLVTYTFRFAGEVMDDLTGWIRFKAYYVSQAIHV